MEVGAWDWTLGTVIQLVAAITTLLAVIVALYIGVSSIRQTRDIQKRERKERLLNEIIEWAEKVCRIRDERPLPKIEEILSSEDEKAYKAWIFKEVAENRQITYIDRYRITI